MVQKKVVSGLLILGNSNYHKGGCRVGEMAESGREVQTVTSSKDRMGAKAAMAMSTSTCQGFKLTCLLLHGASRQPMLALVPVGSTKGPPSQ